MTVVRFWERRRTDGIGRRCEVGGFGEGRGWGEWGAAAGGPPREACGGHAGQGACGVPTCPRREWVRGAGGERREP